MSSYVKEQREKKSWTAMHHWCFKCSLYLYLPSRYCVLAKYYEFGSDIGIRIMYPTRSMLKDFFGCHRKRRTVHGRDMVKIASSSSLSSSSLLRVPSSLRVMIVDNISIASNPILFQIASIPIYRHGCWTKPGKIGVLFDCMAAKLMERGSFYFLSRPLSFQGG
eukprot:scaffold1750_cov108-Cylindrotheca_fusiformis.AAC.2